jgi:trk system potassium uptake protein TrkA
MYIIIIGCGRFGSKLAKDLSDDGNDICVIDRNGDKLNSLGSGFNGQKIKGIEFDSDILMEAGVNHTDALIAVTQDDSINITVSMIAGKIFHVPKIFARINDPEKTYLYNKLGINTINPIQYEIEIIKSRLPIGSMDVVTYLDENYEIIDLLVDRERKMTVNELENKFHCIISGLDRDGTLSLPKKNDIVMKGIRLYCTIRVSDKGKLINYLCKENLL